MEELDKLIGKVSTALENAANTHGPKAVELTLEVARIMAIQRLVAGFIFLALATVFGVIAWKQGWISAKKYKDNNSRDDGFGNAIIAILSSVASFLFSIPVVLNLCSVVYWFGAFRPEVYIAHSVLNKLIN